MKPTTNFVRNHKRREKKFTPTEIASVLPPIPSEYMWVLGENPQQRTASNPTFGLPHQIKIVDMNNNQLGYDSNFDEYTLGRIKESANILLNYPKNKPKFIKLGFIIPEPRIKHNGYGTYK